MRVSFTANRKLPALRAKRRLPGGSQPLLLALIVTIFAGGGRAQSLTPTIPEPIGWEGKLRYHAVSAYGPGALAGAAVYDGFLQGIDFPREWGQGWPGYGKRLGSTLAYSGVRNMLGFGLDSALHQDPRYYRATERGTLRRVKHAFRETILTHKDSGGETLATWRLGSAYGAAFISNEWYPDRVNTVALGLSQGTTQLGFDFLANLGSEFWPDIKRKMHRRKP